MADRAIVEAVKSEFREALLGALGRFPEAATPNDRYLALALAVRTDAPIFASTELIDENAIEFEREVDDTEEIIEGFRDFLRPDAHGFLFSRRLPYWWK